MTELRGSSPDAGPGFVISGSQVAVGNRNVVGFGNLVADTIVVEGQVPVPEPTTREEAAELLLSPPAGPVGDLLPGGWLRPAAGVITPWRRPEFDDLLAWCLDRPVWLLRLVYGAGGQGKTQLAGQVCAELRQRGWLAGFVELSAPGGRQVSSASAWSRRCSEIEAAARALPKLGVPALLVVDYAENHPAPVGVLLREAVRAATAPTASTPLRILLLSRGEVNWLDEHPCWDRVHPEPVLLGPLPGSLREPGDLTGDDPVEMATKIWTRAVTEFAGRAVHAGLLPAAPEPAALAAGSASSFPTTLDLYAEALLRVLDHAQPVTEVGYPDPISGILAHERRVVATALAAAGVELDGYERDLAVCVAFLRPAVDTASAVAALAAAPRLRALPTKQLNQVVDVLARLFPSADGTHVWQAPGPDRLTDTLLLRVAQQARSDKDFFDHVVGVCPGDDPTVANHAARTLLRTMSTPGAAAWYPAGLRRVEGSISALARAYPGEYAPGLTALAPAQFEATILDAVEDRRTPVESVADIDAELRRIGVTTSRLQIAVAVSQRLVAATRPASGGEDLAAVARHADHLVGLSRRLAEAGSAGEAVGPGGCRAVPPAVRPRSRGVPPGSGHGGDQSEQPAGRRRRAGRRARRSRGSRGVAPGAGRRR